MGNIISKLNLNRTPSLVQPNSLVFAKNIRVDIDGSIHKDYAISSMSLKYIGEDLYNYQTIINRIYSDIRTIINESKDDIILIDCCNHYIDKIDEVRQHEGEFNIIDTIANSNEFYILFDCVYSVVENDNTINSRYNMIICYDEKKERFYPCNCNWTYSGGKIDGNVINNLRGEKILVIGESDTNVNVPLKCINLNYSKYTDDESLYTQTPNIPLTNLNPIDRFVYTVPNGVYQFYVRYKIRDDFYTNWFPACKPVYIGNQETTDTNFGSVAYVNIHKDSDESVIFSVEHLLLDCIQNYKSFQIGFIVNHDDAIYARAWKHFNFNQTTINFDYKAEDAIEIEPTDLMNTTYQIYNVGNITNFKNKLYIANYTETDFNEDLQSYADNVRVELATAGLINSHDKYGEYDLIQTNDEGDELYKGFIVNGQNKLFNATSGLINSLFDNQNILDVILSNFNCWDENSFGTLLQNDNTYITRYINSIENVSYGIKLSITRDSLQTAYQKIVDEFHLYYPNENPFLWSSITERVKIGSSYYDTGLNLATIDQMSFDEYNNFRPNDNYTNVRTQIINYIVANIVYLTKNGKFLNSNKELSGSFKVIFFRQSKCKYGSRNYIYTNDEMNIKFSIDASKITTTSVKNIKDYPTLIPYQQYKFYIHYVKENGETTNGYLCSQIRKGKGELTDKSILPIPYVDNFNNAIYPIFKNIEIPNGYKACFFSICHYAINASSVVNLDAPAADGSIESLCVDMNLGINKNYKNVNVKQYLNVYSGISIDIQYSQQKLHSNIHNVRSTKASFYNSNSNNTKYFGSIGVLKIIKPDAPEYYEGDNEDYKLNNTQPAFAIDDYILSEQEDVSLIKCTPYITKDSNGSNINDNTISYDNFAVLNLLGFVCKIYMLSKHKSIDYYTDGSSIYNKTISNGVIHLSELSKYASGSNAPYTPSELSQFNIFSNEPVQIYSRYNLNYLELNEDPKIAMKSHYPLPENTEGNASVTKLYKLFSSLNLTDLYTIPSMYKDYNKQIYYPYNRDSIIKFDNTIRSSELSGDESRIDIFRFNPEDYYNIPTNRGKITNLISVGDVILVHTEDSMFKFTGSNSLQATTGEIQPYETDVFKTGVAELFGSDFGFAGLQNKEDTIITENGYIFFDRDSNIIYMYSGQGQIKKLSDDIQKLFRYGKIANIRFANDYYNNRFFVCIWFTHGNSVTLSYSFLDNIKAFVSVHDFEFTKAFNTKTNCYFIAKENKNICNINKNEFGYYMDVELSSDNNIFPQYKSTEMIYTKGDNNDRPIPLEVTIFASIVDVIDNSNYELIKTLDSIKWNSAIITNDYPSFAEIHYDSEIDDTYETYNNNLAESKYETYPCDSLKIYTNLCESEIIDCTNISNDFPSNSEEQHKYPRYNQGYWSFNYFRDINNTEDIFGYNKDLNHDYDDSDNQSLIEGKYFVVRFIYESNRDFKLETLTTKYTYKL